MNLTFLTAVATPSLALSHIVAPVREIGGRALKNRLLGAQKGTHIDLMIICLWSTAGLVLTGLLASLGFSDQITQFLAAAG